MRCGCPHCGIYMVNRERGLKSECVCPNCLFTCNACMGTEAVPLSHGELELQALLRQRLRELEQEEEE